MKIVIAGAGAIGFHLAELLSKEKHDITLIDKEEDVLNHAKTHLDVLTLQGDAASIRLLKNAKTEKAHLFIAVTTSEKTNLLLAILAKQLGAKTTIARINNSEYFEKTQKENFKLLGVDVLISPQLLAAQEIDRLIQRASFTDILEFEQGKLFVVGFTIDQNSTLLNQSFREISTAKKKFVFRGIALLRGDETIIPSAETILKKGDHLYISTRKQFLDEAIKFVGKPSRPIKNIMLIGDTPMTLKTAQILEPHYALKVVLNNKAKAKYFLETLHESLIIQADPGNIDALKEEGFEKMDAFIALTPNSETNIITSLMAEEAGVHKTIALVENVNYTHISQNIGIDTIINKKIIAANNIFRYVRKGKIQTIVSLHGVEAEMIEFEIHKKNRLLKHPLKNLPFPKKSIIAGVIRANESFIPDDEFRFELNDKVIIFALPEVITQVEEIFK